MVTHDMIVVMVKVVKCQIVSDHDTSDPTQSDECSEEVLEGYLGELEEFPKLETFARSELANLRESTIR